MTYGLLKRADYDLHLVQVSANNINVIMVMGRIGNGQKKWPHLLFWEKIKNPARLICFTEKWPEKQFLDFFFFGLTSLTWTGNRFRLNKDTSAQTERCFYFIIVVCSGSSF